MARRDDDVQLTLDTPDAACASSPRDRVTRRRAALRSALGSVYPTGEPGMDRDRAIDQLVNGGDDLYAAEIALRIAAGQFSAEWRAVRKAAFAIRDAR